MLKPTCIALGVTPLAFGFGGLAAQAGWMNAAPSLAGAKGGPSLVLQVKKKKRDDEDDNGDNDGKQENAKHKGKNKNNEDNHQETTESPPSGGGGKVTTPSSSNSNSSSGTLLPYYECDLTKPGGCSPPKQ